MGLADRFVICFRGRLPMMRMRLGSFPQGCGAAGVGETRFESLEQTQRGVSSFRNIVQQLVGEVRDGAEGDV
jgi:hypothetical protein